MLKSLGRLICAVACASALASACSGDDDDSMPSGAGGRGGAGGNSDASAGIGGSSAGTGGSSAGTGGTDAGPDTSSAGTGGADAGADTGNDVVDAATPPEALNPHGIVVIGAHPATADAGSTSDAGNSQRVVLATSDYATSTDVSTFSVKKTDFALHSLALDHRLTIEDGDTVVAESRGRAFALARRTDKVYALDPNGTIEQVIDLKGAADADAGVHAGNAEAGTRVKAYVPLYNASRIAVLSLNDGTVSGAIDLSAYNAPDDDDGRPEVDAPVYVPTQNRAYFVLARLDIRAVYRDGTVKCSDRKALLVAVDTTTDHVVDLNGAAPGEALELSLAQPVDMLYGAAQNSLFIASSGCESPTDAGTKRERAGIEQIDLTNLTSPTSKVLVNAPAGIALTQILNLHASDALVAGYDADFADRWYTWPIGGTTLPIELLTQPPHASVALKPRELLGFEITSADAGSTLEFWHYDVRSASVTLDLFDSLPWSGGAYVVNAVLVE